jgi:ketosteroid isomerase-like protein
MKMKKLIFSLFLVSVAFGAVKDDVLSAEKNWASKVVALDFAALEQIYHADLIYAHSTGGIETKSDYMGKLRTGKQKYTSITHHSSTVRVHGDAAVVHSIVTMQGTNPAGPFDDRLMMLHTWVKSGGHWRLAAHQTTRLEK